MCNETCSCTEPKCKPRKQNPPVVDGWKVTDHAKPLLDQIGALTRTAQQFEHKAASLRLLARRLQERVNRGER